MRNFFNTLFVLVIATAILYAVWTVGMMFDDMKATYRDELHKSQLLNHSAQQRIIELMDENARLREELEEICRGELCSPAGAHSAPLQVYYAGQEEEI